MCSQVTQDVLEINWGRAIVKIQLCHRQGHFSLCLKISTVFEEAFAGSFVLLHFVM